MGPWGGASGASAHMNAPDATHTRTRTSAICTWRSPAPRRTNGVENKSRGVALSPHWALCLPRDKVRCARRGGAGRRLPRVTAPSRSSPFTLRAPAALMRKTLSASALLGRQAVLRTLQVRAAAGQQTPRPADVFSSRTAPIRQCLQVYGKNVILFVFFRIFTINIVNLQHRKKFFFF